MRQCGGVVEEDGSGCEKDDAISNHTHENVAKIENLHYLCIIRITYTSNKQELNNG